MKKILKLAQLIGGLFVIGWATQAGAVAYSSDLVLTLQHSDTTVQLFQGAMNDTPGNLVTTFDDESANPHNGSAPFPSDMQSFQALSAFDGGDLAGIWTLSILDTYFPGEGDILVSWGISGTMVGGGTFSFAGPGALNVDADPALQVLLQLDLSPTLITDLNVSVAFDNPGPGDPLPAPAGLLLVAIGLLAARLALPRR